MSERSDAIRAADKDATGPGKPGASGEIGGVLFDIEGVLYSGAKGAQAAVPGAAQTLQAVRAAGLPHAFVSNITSVSRATIVEQLAGFGMDIPLDQLFTPAIAARRYIEAEGLAPAAALVAPALLEDLGLVEAEPGQGEAGALVLGNLGRGMDFDYVQRAFEACARGARLLALHKNRFEKKDGQRLVDLGAFVAAVEYASAQEAVILGKPAPAYFDMALAGLGVERDRVLMIGDDLMSDIAGAKAAGLVAALVLSGKTGGVPDDLPAEQAPDFIWDDVTQLQRLLG